MSLHLCRSLTVALLVMGGMTLTAHADARKDFDKALAATGCPDIVEQAASSRFVLLSEWSGRSLIDLARRAGFGDKINNLGEDENFLPEDEKEQAAILDKMAKAAGDATARLSADSKSFGKKLCPLLQVEGFDRDFETVLKEQKRANAAVRPYLRFAQHLSLLNGCSTALADGAFGPDSRAAWNKLAAVVAPDQVVAEAGFPVPGDVLAVALKPVASGACDSDKGKAAYALYPFAFTPNLATGDIWAGMSAAEAMQQLAEATKFAPTHLRNRLVAHVLGGWNGAGDSADGEGEDAGRIIVSEDEVFNKVWPLVKEDFSAFVKDLPGYQVNYLVLAQRLLLGAGGNAQPGPAIELLDSLAEDDAEATRYLAGVYQFGLGVEADPAKAKDLIARADEKTDDFNAFADYDAARNDGVKAAEHVKTLLENDENAQSAGEDGNGEDTGGEDSVPFRKTVISMADLADFSRATRLIVSFPEALAVVKAAPARQRVIFGEMILEGWGGEEPHREMGIGLIESAANEGFADAALRLAHIRRFQDPPDLAAAERLYKTAAEGGSAEAAFALAEMADGDGGAQTLAKARSFYDKAVELATPASSWDLASALQNRIVEGSTFLNSKDGEAWLKERVAKNYKLSLALADAYLCTSCGGIVDIAAGASWYRQAAAQDEDGEQETDKTASYKLARLLIAHPELEKTKGEALAILKRNAPPKPEGEEDNWYSDEKNWHAESALLLLSEELRRSGAPDDQRKSRLKDFFASICALKDEPHCLRLAHAMANGQFDTWLVAPGYQRLKELHEAAPEDAATTSALADTLAAYGDFRGAVTLLSQGSDSTYSDYSLRIAKRIITTYLRRPSFELPDGLAEYLQLVGDDDAQALLELVDNPPAGADGADKPAMDVATAQAAFDQQLARGALSRGLAATARRLSQAHRAAGDKDEALKLEFTALTTELKLARNDGVFDGALPARLARVCLLSRSSERVSDMGFTDAAIALAKYTVNELQAARRDIAQLPESLRTCFRNLAADNYRRLADLFEKNGRHAEARYVMGLLKDFETYEFVGRDRDYQQRSYDGFALDQLERDFTQALEAITVPITGKARWLADARWKARNGKLSAAELKEKDKIEQELAEAGKAFREQLTAIVTTVDGLGHFDAAKQLDDLKGLQSFLRSEAGGKAAALHYIVLPERMHVLLTTANSQIGRTIETLDGQPFSEAALDKKLDHFRALLQQPDSDPEPLARELYALLVKPMEKEIAAAGITTLLISPDRRLRYIPFAALHDDKGYLAQQFSIAMLSDAGYEIVGDHRTGLEISALGMTQAVGDFTALPNVGSELAGIVKGTGSAYGFLPGQILMDASFTGSALRDALQFGPNGALGVVHIASHFALGANDETSKLLLGDKSWLSLATIKSDTNSYDFASVDLLTLSACSTAYGLANSDGRDIESFSQVAHRGGARAILASLWPVNDLSTSLLMQRFYELRERRNLDKATALATVQREFLSRTLGEGDQSPSIVVETARRGGISLGGDVSAQTKLKGFQHPFYWAPFIIMGNWQ